MIVAAAARQNVIPVLTVERIVAGTADQSIVKSSTGNCPLGLHPVLDRCRQGLIEQRSFADYSSIAKFIAVDGALKPTLDQGQIVRTVPDDQILGTIGADGERGADFRSNRQYQPVIRITFDYIDAIA